MIKSMSRILPSRPLSPDSKEVGKLRHFKEMQVFGHRGASYDCPENTWRAFHLAQSFGAQGIELDLQGVNLRNGCPSFIVLHDSTLRRTCVGSMADGDKIEDLLDIPVSDLTMEDLERINVGTPGKQESVPRLEEVFYWCIKDNFPVLAEVKSNDLSIVEPLAMLLQSVLGPLPDDKKELIRIISFDFQIVKELSKRIPYLATYWVVEEKDFSHDMIEVSKEAGLKGLDLEVCSKAEPYLKQARQQNLSTIVWVNRAENTDGYQWALRMEEAGAEIFTSDLPPSMILASNVD